jgi:hypothetical protein
LPKEGSPGARWNQVNGRLRFSLKPCFPATVSRLQMFLPKAVIRLLSGRQRAIRRINGTDSS